MDRYYYLKYHINFMTYDYLRAFFGWVGHYRSKVIPELAQVASIGLGSGKFRRNLKSRFKRLRSVK